MLVQSWAVISTNFRENGFSTGSDKTKTSRAELVFNVTRNNDQARKIRAEVNEINCTSIYYKNENKIFQLPIILNLNPRSIYNKYKEFKDFIENHSIDIIFMSESWEREDHLVKDLLKLENYDIVSNVHQRKGRGGRPLIIVDNEKYIVEDLTNKVVDIPWGVEVVWDCNK